MNAIIYLLQVSACLTLFYGFYYSLLNRLTFFTINRYYLLFTLVFSFIIPLLTIPVHQQYTAAPVMQQVIQMRSMPSIPDYTFTPITAPIKTTMPITWMQLLNWVYLAAVAGLSIHLLITLFNFFIKLKRRKLSSLGNIHILRGDKKLPNGSFLNYIFLNDDALSAEEMEQIVAHEMLHVKLYHSADRILMKLVQIILWFNPLVYFYARSMEENHEFEVDREIAQSTDKTKYADLLVHLSVANQGMLYHSFSKVPLKKRIIMLFNKPSAKVKRAVYILVLPVILLSCLAFAKIKKVDIKIDLVKSGKEILGAIKTGQEDIIQQLNNPVQISIIPTDSTKTILSGTESDTTAHYSEVIQTFGKDPLENMFNGKTPIVVIDGKEYPVAIIYKISTSCIAAFSISLDAPKIELKTKNGQIIYMTAHEKENLYKEHSISTTQFYTRMPFTKDNGERYDYIVVVSNLRSISRRIAPDDKVGFMIDGKLYSEDDIKTLSPEITASLKGLGSYYTNNLYQNKYKVLYTLITPGYQSQKSDRTIFTSTINAAHNEGQTTPAVIYTAPETSAQTKGTQRSTYYAGPDTNSRRFSIQYNYDDRNDTLEYNLQAYKVTENGSLTDLLTNLPNIKVVNNDIFIGSKKLTLLINGKPYKGNMEEILKYPGNFFAGVFVYNGKELNMTTDPKKGAIFIYNPK